MTSQAPKKASSFAELDCKTRTSESKTDDEYFVERIGSIKSRLVRSQLATKFRIQKNVSIKSGSDTSLRLRISKNKELIDSQAAYTVLIFAINTSNN